MRHVLSFGVFLVCPCLCAQNPPATLDALMTEVRELRLAIERSTLLGTRTQIAIQRLQVQQERVTQTEQKLEDARRMLTQYQQGRLGLAAELKDLESQVLRTTDPNARIAFEARIEAGKRSLADVTGEAPLRARESELLYQFQNEQATFNRLQSDISQMESTLDRAIQQITGQR